MFFIRKKKVYEVICNEVFRTFQALATDRTISKAKFDHITKCHLIPLQNNLFEKLQLSDTDTSTINKSRYTQQHQPTTESR